MEQVSARATLVPASDLGDGLTTTIPRSDIQAVLAAEEEPIELVLDVARSSDGEAAETRNVSVAWERTDLEQLLEEAQGDQIVLTFDREALARATDDVEAHGFREAALAIAVAATVAAGGAQAAAAEPGPMLGEKAPITQSTAPAGPQIPYLSQGQGVTPAELGIATGTAPDDRAVARVDEPTLSPDDRAVARTDSAAAPTPAGPQIPYLSQGEGVTSAELGFPTGVAPDDRAVARVDEPTLSPDDRAVARTDPVAAPTPAAPQIPYLSQGEGVTSAELGFATGTAPDDRALPRTDPVATTGGTVSDPGTFSVPGPETVVVAGAIALLITGAFFLIGTDRRRIGTT